MKTVRFPDGETVPALGLGTWKIGVGDPEEAAQLKALEAGIAAGMTLIDTAEMYGDGRSEQLVAKAIAGKRDKIFLVSKVLPSNASRSGTVKACEASLKRLGTDVIDLYLLHWRGSYPLRDTVAAFEQLKRDGKIRNWGVSNFDTDDMQELEGLSKDCAADQVQYNARDRGIEFDLLPWCGQRGIPVMAYCPLGEGDLAGHPALRAIGARHGVSAATAALAFLLSKPGVIAIPKSSHPARVMENAKAAEIVLSAEDLAAIDAAFPPPKRKSGLAMT